MRNLSEVKRLEALWVESERIYRTVDSSPIMADMAERAWQNYTKASIRARTCYARGCYQATSWCPWCDEHCAYTCPGSKPHAK